MGKVKIEKPVETERVSKSNKSHSKKSRSSDESELNLKKSDESYIILKKISFKKKYISNIIKNEHQFISSLFDILDLAKLNQGRKNDSDEDDNSERMQLADIPDQKVFKKKNKKKGSSQVSSKRKSFPQTVEGLEKELAEFKGMRMTYLQKLRKKGLQSRLLKKKKKQLKLKKSPLKTANKHKSGANGLSKTKLILNSDGNVVSNKFDFADTDIKKDNKKKMATANNEMSSKQPVNLPNGHLNQNNLRSKENFKSDIKSDLNKNNSLKTSPIKKENRLENNVEESSSNVKPSSKQGPVFNRDNKIVFSKVHVPDNKKTLMNKVSKKNNPKKILEKLKKDNTKIFELEKEDREKAVSLKEKQKWAAALKRASGEKVKDDPELLRKSIAREKNKKMRSQKKWKARIDHIEKEKEEKQKKRYENIQSRKTEKKKKKMKKAIKKGSYIPL